MDAAEENVTEDTGKTPMKIIIIGGGAAGASAAARLRRLDEKSEILLLEKGEFISYANCGLPYHLGKVIEDRDDLLVMSPEKFSAWLNVEVRTRHEVIAIDPAKKQVTAKTPDGERVFPYDKLLLATGAVPNSSGNVSPGILPLWTIGDMDRIADRLEGAKSAIVVGVLWDSKPPKTSVDGGSPSPSSSAAIMCFPPWTRRCPALWRMNLPTWALRLNSA